VYVYSINVSTRVYQKVIAIKMHKSCADNCCDAKNCFSTKRPIIVKTSGKGKGKVVNWRDQVFPPSSHQAVESDVEKEVNVPKRGSEAKKKDAAVRNWRAEVFPASDHQEVSDTHVSDDGDAAPDLESDSDDDGEVKKKKKLEKKSKKRSKEERQQRKKERREQRKERRKEERRKERPVEQGEREQEQQEGPEAKSMMKDQCGCPRGKPLAEWKRDRQKEQDKQRGVKEVTNARRICPKVVQTAVDAANVCSTKYKCCAELRFHVVRHLRSLLYGPGMSQAKRRKVICSWLLEILNETKKDLAKRNVEWTEKKPVTEWFLYDLSYESSQIKRKISCCRDCFVRCTGISNGSVTTWLSELKKGNLSIAMEENKRSRFVDEKTPERMITCTWMEMYVSEQACKSPDGKKSEVFASSRKEMYDHFCKDWNDEVLSGGVYRKYKSHRGKYKKKPPGVAASGDRENAPREGRGEDEEEESDENKHDSVIKMGPPSYQFFCKVWAKDFNEYKIPRHQRRFTQCNWCCEIKGNLKYAKDDDKVYWRQCLFDHYAWITVQRDKYYKHRYKATKHKSK